MRVAQGFPDRVLVQLIDALHRHGSWCGETHVQKCAFLLQEGLGIPAGYQFVLYKHGPFSFPLRSELERLISEGVVCIQPRPAPYGPSLAVNSHSDALGLEPEAAKAIEHVAHHFGQKGVAELERLSTALYVKNQFPEQSCDQLANEIVKLKPHILPDLAHSALREVAQVMDQFVAD